MSVLTNSKVPLELGKFKAAKNFNQYENSLYCCLTYGLIETLIRFKNFENPIKTLKKKLAKDLNSAKKRAMEDKNSLTSLSVFEQVFNALCNLAPNAKDGMSWLEHYSQQDLIFSNLVAAMLKIVHYIRKYKIDLKSKTQKDLDYRLLELISVRYRICIELINANYSKTIFKRDTRKYIPILYIFKCDGHFKILYTIEALDIESGINDSNLILNSNLVFKKDANTLENQILFKRTLDPLISKRLETIILECFERKLAEGTTINLDIPGGPKIDKVIPDKLKPFNHPKIPAKIPEESKFIKQQRPPTAKDRPIKNLKNFNDFQKISNNLNATMSLSPRNITKNYPEKDFGTSIKNNLNITKVLPQNKDLRKSPELKISSPKNNNLNCTGIKNSVKISHISPEPKLDSPIFECKKNYQNLRFGDNRFNSQIKRGANRFPDKKSILKGPSAERNIPIYEKLSLNNKKKITNEIKPSKEQEKKYTSNFICDSLRLYRTHKVQNALNPDSPKPNINFSNPIIHTEENMNIYSYTHTEFYIEVKRGRMNNKNIVIKRYKSIDSTLWKPEKFNPEIQIIQKCSEFAQLGHPFLECFGVHLTDGNLTILLESIEMDLWRRMENMKAKKEQFTEDELKKIVSRLIEGFSLLEQVGIKHQDVRPQNILILGSGKNIDVKIIDFSVSEFKINEMPNTYTGQVRGAEMFRAPEVLGKEWTRFNSIKADVYSLGLVFYQMYDVNINIRGKNEESYELKLSREVKKVKYYWLWKVLEGMLCSEFIRKTFREINQYLPDMIT